MVHDHTALHAPENSEDGSLLGRVLESQGLRPLNEIVGQRSRPKRSVRKLGLMGSFKRILCGDIPKFVEQVAQTARTQSHAVVP